MLHTYNNSSSSNITSINFLACKRADSNNSSERLSCIGDIKSWYIFGKQSKAIGPRISTSTGTSLVVSNLKPSFFKILFNLGRSSFKEESRNI